jgi:carbonic anhydrase
MENQSLGIINKWLRNIKDVYKIHQDEINKEVTQEERANKLAEFNVQEQIMNLAKTSIIQKAWKNEQRPHLHGWIYGLNDGIIKPVCEMEPGSQIDPLYVYDNI